MSLGLNGNCDGVVDHDEPEQMLHHADNIPGVVATYSPQPVSKNRGVSNPGVVATYSPQPVSKNRGVTDI